VRCAAGSTLRTVALTAISKHTLDDDARRPVPRGIAVAMSNRGVSDPPLRLRAWSQARPGGSLTPGCVSLSAMFPYLSIGPPMIDAGRKAVTDTRTL